MERLKPGYYETTLRFRLIQETEVEELDELLEDHLMDCKDISSVLLSDYEETDDYEN